MDSAAREFHEESGCVSAAGLRTLGLVSPDLGRLAKRVWCSIALNVTTDPDGTPESGVVGEWYTPTELQTAVRDSSLDNGISLTTLALALFDDSVPAEFHAALAE